MKTIVKVGLAFSAALSFLGASSRVAAFEPTNVPSSSLLSTFTNNPVAIHVISNLLSEPQPALVTPVFSTTNAGPAGTYWPLSAPAPWPFNPFPEMQVYQVSTNHDFIIDDRSVNYAALAAEEASNNPIHYASQAENLTAIDTNDLWLEVPTNSLVDSNVFNVVIHNTTNGDLYAVLTKTDLLLPTWTTEMTVTGAIGNLTPVTLSQNGRTNLFVWERTASIVINTQPMSQEVLDGDIVTFTVSAVGSGLTYQWTLNGTNIYGATGSSYTINAVDISQAGDYVCIITDANGSETSQTATLTVDAGTGYPDGMIVVGQRQDYVFRSGVTYLIESTIQLYGNTTFQPAAIIKFDYHFEFPFLQVMGTVDCQGKPYNPSILTTVDDDTFGKIAADPFTGAKYSSEDGPPEPVYTGVPYLDLTYASDVSLSDMRFHYADMAVGSPQQSRLDVWDTQFLQCNAAVENDYGGTDGFHNVLLSACYSAVVGYTNPFAIDMEQVTANVTNLWYAPITPSSVNLTNTIVLGSIGVASMVDTYVNPDVSNFQTNGAGNYYLTAASSLHQAGTTLISPYLLNEFSHKTTYAPMAFPTAAAFQGSLTLSPQVPRYTNGAPDVGYYYDVMDYTTALFYNYGATTILPGTVIGMRQDLTLNSFCGMDLTEESSLVGHGTPAKPIVFADVQWVQEQSEWPCYALFIPDFQGATNDAAPVMDFRFCNFYPAAGCYHVWAGMDENLDYIVSYSSVVNWTMRDCNLYGGIVNLGEPDAGIVYGLSLDDYYGSGSVAWDNNLFENVTVNLQPTYDWYDGSINVDLALEVHNNLLRNGSLIVVPVPASTGNWTIYDNLFDQVQFYLNVSLPLDYDNNGYWPLTPVELTGGVSQLLPTITGDGTTNGLNEVVLNYAPPYVSGPFGNYYLSTITPLWQAGSRTAGDAGLAQYTTFASQAKDTSNQPVNIGLHYIAADTNGLVLDSDGDGIPDYVEAEHGTDPNNAITDGSTPDALNSAYDDVDLSGDGLVGRIKKALGVNPLDAENPFTLQQVITGEEPDFATFEVPISYDAVTNSGELNVNMNGIDVTLEECTRAVDGNCLLSFNVAFDPAGSHYLSAGFRLGTDPETDYPVTIAGGIPQLFTSSNSAQFFEANSMFDNTSAYLDAQCSLLNADYIINLYNPDTTPPTWLNAITNSTTDGSIQEEWNLTCADGSTYTGNSISAEYDISPSDGNGNYNNQMFNPKRILTRATNSLSEWGPNIDVAYFFTPTNSSLGIEFAQDGAVWNGMQGVVDTLTMPIWDYPVYNSYFDNYTCYYCGGDSRPYPGYIQSRSDVTNHFLPDIANGLTKQIFIYAHGTNGWLSNWTGDSYMTSYDVGTWLRNTYSKKGGLQARNPYRFVFLDGCSTASGKDWRRAFGIYPLDVTNKVIRSKVGPQAYVGWANVHTGWFNQTQDNIDAENIETAYAQTLANFYSEWMHEGALDDCIYDATKSSYGAVPIPTPENKETIFQVNGYQYDYTNVTTSKIYLIGYPGLKVDTTDKTRNTDSTYAPPKNIE